MTITVNDIKAPVQDDRLQEIRDEAKQYATDYGLPIRERLQELALSQQRAGNADERIRVMSPPYPEASNPMFAYLVQTAFQQMRAGVNVEEVCTNLAAQAWAEGHLSAHGRTLPDCDPQPTSTWDREASAWLDTPGVFLQGKQGHDKTTVQSAH